MALSEQQLLELYRAGWEREVILRLDQLMGILGHDPELVDRERVTFGPWAVYRSAHWGDLRRALRLADRATEETVIWTDGSGTFNDDHAGIGVVVDEGEHGIREYSEYIGLGTNNVAELTAIYRGLQAVPDRRRKILVRSDSEYSIGILTKPWVPKKNKELVEAIRADLEWRGPNVRFQHVRGHVGIEGNERADKLAKAGREKGFKPQGTMRIVPPTWPEDLGLLAIQCPCGHTFPQRPERFKVKCKYCGKTGDLKALLVLQELPESA